MEEHSLRQVKINSVSYLWSDQLNDCVAEKSSRALLNSYHGKSMPQQSVDVVTGPPDAWHDGVRARTS